MDSISDLYLDVQYYLARHAVGLADASAVNPKLADAIVFVHFETERLKAEQIRDPGLKDRASDADLMAINQRSTARRRQ